MRRKLPKPQPNSKPERAARTAADPPALARWLFLRRPFRQWYETHYGVSVGKKKKKEGEEKVEDKKVSKSIEKKRTARQEGRVLDPNVNSQFDPGRLLACIASRPGQCGRCDGFILEGKELEFYVKKMARKKK